MTSAASRFVLTPCVAGTNTSSPRVNSVSFQRINNNRRVVVRAEDAAAPTPAPAAEGEAKPAVAAKPPPPPPIGPKRGTKASTQLSLLLLSFFLFN